MSLISSVQTSKLVCGIDVTNILPSAGTAVINGPMHIGLPAPGQALVNIKTPTGIPSIKGILSSNLAVDIVSPTIGVQIKAPLAASLIGSVSIDGSVTGVAAKVLGIISIAGRIRALERVQIFAPLEVLSQMRVGSSAEIYGSLFVGGVINNAWLNAQLASKKSFDIEHPSKPETHRLRYVCLEGPEAGVYLRGKIKESNIITLPDYFKDLVDVETIAVNLTPIGKYQELYVDDIRWGKQVIIKNNLGGSVHCYYTIFAERKDVDKNISEYEGTSLEDYPGDNSVYRIG